MPTRPLLLFILAAAVLLPITDLFLFPGARLADSVRPVFPIAILSLAVNVFTGLTGILQLGIAAFMAIGVYAFAILTCDIYPFQLPFWWGVCAATVIGGLFGALLGIPTLRLRGDYLAIVTLGFGEIVQDCLKYLDVITKGTKGINPLPSPTVFGQALTPQESIKWYYLCLGVVTIVVLLLRHIERSRLGRTWRALRDDELAASCVGINPPHAKLAAFTLGASLAALAGALWAGSLGSSGEPQNYDFQLSIMALCSIIVGGMGNIAGVLIGTTVMVLINSVVLIRLTELLSSGGNGSVFLSPASYKYMIFGFALVLMVRFRPQGMIPETEGEV